ncbi:hypothetical protein BTM342_15100 [Helicobacter pylori]
MHTAYIVIIAKITIFLCKNVAFRIFFADKNVAFRIFFADKNVAFRVVLQIRM